MAGQTGRPSPALIEALLADGGEHSFYQALRLLERDAADEGAFRKSVRVRPELSLDFPGSDVVAVERRDDDGYRVLVSFLGLYGVSSPLPIFYTEDLMAAEQEDRTAARHLLDLLHRRLYLLAYEAAKKYRPLFRVVEDDSKDIRGLLFSLVGLRDKKLHEASRHTPRLLRYVGLFGQQPRSALGLKTLLEDAFPGIRVAVNQCLPRTSLIPERQRFELGGHNNALGENSVLGQQVRDHNARIAVRIGPLSGERFHELRSDPEQSSLLNFLITRYLNTPVECLIEWVLASGEARGARMGEKRWSTLGEDTWLVRRGDAGEASGLVRL